jgi:4-amino-4-deoxy-L-arabinose transferase-like glycosyltransferase
MISFVSLLLLIYIVFIWVRILNIKSFCSVIFTATLILSLLIFWSSLFASYQNNLTDLGCWNIFFVIIAIFTTCISLYKSELSNRVWKNRIDFSKFENKLKILFSSKIVTILFVAIILISFMNLFIIMWFEPGTPDVLEYHLARVAYYLQQGSFAHYNAHYWAQEVYPLVSTSIFTFITLIANKNAGLSALAQWIACWVAMISVYGIARQLGANIHRSAIAAIVFSSLTIVIAEAATAQNDLLMAALTGITIYYFISYYQKRKILDIIFAIISAGLLVGIKFTWILVALPLLILIIYCIKLDFRKWLLITFISTIVIFTIILPSGYLINYQKYGDFLGPLNIRSKYTNEGYSVVELFIKSIFNIVRYSVDGVSLDGYIPGKVVNSIQWGLRAPIEKGVSSIGLDLTSEYGVKLPYVFSYYRQTTATENSSGYGIAGFLLIIPAMIIALFMPGLPRLLSILFCTFIISQSLASPYDYFHFRFFVLSAVFVTPLIAIVNWKPWYLNISIFMVLVGAISTSLCRQGISFIPVYVDNKWYPPYLPVSRSEQLSREVPDRQMMFELIDVIFPVGSKIALDFRPIIAEYAFFGDGLNRKCYPIRDFEGNRVPLPIDTDYLVYSEDSPLFRKGDPVIIGGHERYGTIFYRQIKGNK